MLLSTDPHPGCLPSSTTSSEVPFIDGKGVAACTVRSHDIAGSRAHPAYAQANHLILPAIMNCETLQSCALPHVMAPVTCV